MAKGFFISKSLGAVGLVLGLGAVATIIALSVVYSQEKQRADDLSNQIPSSTSVAVTPGTAQATTANGSVQTTTTKPLEPWDHFRLPKTLMPTFYTISLQPFLTEVGPNFYIFKGNSTVEFQCKQPTDLILIHSKKLNYTLQGAFLVSLMGIDDANPPAIHNTWLEEKTEYLVVKLKGNLQQNKKYQLHAVFTGELADDLAGFYRSAYTEGTATKLLATTQMQAADARKAFPCFDEPAMKANFSITLIHLPGYEALSNMPIKRTEAVTMPSGEIWTRTEFHPTLKMSTYLLGFIVSEFEKVSVTENNTLIQIWGRPKAIREGQGAYALNVTGTILHFFEKEYRVPYPLTRLDQVALPDFNAGAMENWGLITYRESALLFDQEYSSIGNKERIVTVIAHEVAHQWFGNLVTLEWWNELWLNEGFASYVEYLGAHEAESTWNIKDLIVPNDVYRVMAIDALASSHPLSSPAEEINTPAQISEVFDSISYSKGAAVIRMLSEFLTEAVFREGLQTYFETYQYGNTVCDDLWEQLQKAVKKNVNLPSTVKTIMDRWTLQMGFPVLTVNTATGIISQKHFLLDPESPVERPSPFKYIWIVPVSWLSKGKAAEMYWLTDTTAENVNFSTSADPTQWLLLNVNVTGYFRVNYNLENWQRLMNQLNEDLQMIPVLNRAQIIDDAFNLARAKHVGTDLALNTTRYLALEREYLPWDTALGNLDYFRLMFDRSEVYGPMQGYIRKQVTPLFEHFRNLTQNWTKIPDGLMNQYNQILAIRTACSYGVPGCNELAASWFKAWEKNDTNNPISPNLRSAVYCSAIRTGSLEDWDFAWKMFRQAPVISEADKLRAALTCSQTPWILQRYLQYTLDPNMIRRQDAMSTINSIASNVVGQSLAWDFVRMNWKTLFQQFGRSSFSFSSVIQSVTQRFSSPFELQQLEQFKKDNADVGFGSATRALEQALERTKANIKWVAENKALVLKWFQENS
ncbi:aminopeptidase N [Protobothrops mucrosquamatus]|uniref:aminopeptidase N n=1 Tax=Protobothrops mucrosquamatus TaxID=103944 RepID=UPI000775A621|nr:aminopeptidase N [Protobothrops mucrosquamatus]